MFGHAHGFGGLQDCGIDAGEADVGVAKDWEYRVENEGDDRGARADSADERNRNEEAEKREAGNGLENAGDAESDGTQSGRCTMNMPSGTAMAIAMSIEIATSVRCVSVSLEKCRRDA